MGIVFDHAVCPVSDRGRFGVAKSPFVVDLGKKDSHQRRGTVESVNFHRRGSRCIADLKRCCVFFARGESEGHLKEVLRSFARTIRRGAPLW